MACDQVYLFCGSGFPAAMIVAESHSHTLGGSLHAKWHATPALHDFIVEVVDGFFHGVKDDPVPPEGHSGLGSRVLDDGAAVILKTVVVSVTSKLSRHVRLLVCFDRGKVPLPQDSARFF
jgi:hypothetical protein